jgi:hypothetical protein
MKDSADELVRRAAATAEADRRKQHRHRARSEKMHMCAAVNRVSNATSPRSFFEPLEGRVLLSASLGGGLQFQDENTYDHALADLVKATTEFKNLSGGAAAVDANGYPTEDFVVNLWNGPKLDAGTYTIAFDGPDSTAISFDRGGGVLTKQAATAENNEVYTFDVPAGAKGANLALKFTNTGGQVKDLHVMQPGTAVGDSWKPGYVAQLQSLHPQTLRMMDIVKANSNNSLNWSDRPEKTDANYAAKGVDWESLIELCNKVDANIWVCIPVSANDDYIKQLASLLKTKLNPNLKVYVELANEVWSSGTFAGMRNKAAAEADVAGNAGSNLKYDGSGDHQKWAERFYARREMQISDLFKSVWTSNFNGTTPQANPTNPRVRVILGGQAAVSERIDNMLAYLNANYGAPKNYLYGTGLAYYFTLNKFADQFNPGGSLKTAQVLEGMDLSVQNYESGWFKGPTEQAAKFGLKFEAYELGVDTMGALNIEAKAAASLDPQMSSLMQRFVNTFKSQGGDTAMWFVLGSDTYGQPSGTFPITNDPTNLNSPKEQGFRLLRGYGPTV